MIRLPAFLDTMNDRQKRLAADIFAALVIASVAWALAGLTWRLMGYATQEPVAVPAGHAAAGVDIAPLIALAPFGIASGGAVEQGGGDLTLRAIFAAFPASNSVALIAGPDGEVIPVSIGDSTPGGIVEAIEPEKVMLRTSSGLRVLGFGPEEGGGAARSGFSASSGSSQEGDRGGTSGSPRTSRPAGVESIRALIPPGARSPSAAPSAPVPPPSDTSPQPAEERGSIEPSRQGASASGYRVPARPPSQLRAAGIRGGDVIRSVNGKAVSAGTSQSALLQQAMASGRGGSDTARIELLRDGKPVSLTVPLR